MILHGVYLRLTLGRGGAELASVMAGLEGLCADLPGCIGLNHGPNVDMEGKSPDYPYGFMVSFETHQALTLYAEHPTHQALGARLCALCEGGGDGITVYDLEVTAP